MSKSFKRSIKNVVNGYSSAQVKVRNATSNETYGPSTSDMEELADLTYEHVEFLEIMDMLDKRLNDKGKNWRHVAKALTVLDFLVRCGSENTVRWSRDNLYIIKTLREFQYVDDEGHDQGSIVRVKAKELTSLLRDDERLRQERELRSNGRRRNRPRRQDIDDEEDEDELAKALRESKRTAEEDERRRLQSNEEDDSLATALRLSREEEEARKQREAMTAQDANLLDLSDTYQGVQYDVWGNPIYPGQEAAYQQQLLLQQQAQQQALLLQQQQEAQAQAQQQEWLQQQYLQQQYLQQQQLQQQQQQQQQQEYLQQQQYLAQQQQQQQPLKTGSNNPFALNNQEPTSQPNPEPIQQVQQAPQPGQKLTRTNTGSSKYNDEYSELNQLLAQGTGIDTFGNEGNTRIPVYHTKTGTFVNSSGTGYRPTTNNAANPFLGAQYTGVASTGIVPSYTGYGFGNQNQQQPQSQQSSRGNEQSLIDI